MNRIFALVDCNNFYASCERVFAPAIIGKPVVVLSNNDGCIVARSQEAKDLGIRMGEPFFKAEPLLKKHDAAVFSSNYALYADMSRRVMETLSNFTPTMEVYSIDEAFLELTDIPADLAQLGADIRTTVRKWTGIPVSVGIAATKTLAKVANHIAKKSEKAAGVLSIADGKWTDSALDRTPVGEVWGVGSRTAAKLMRMGIKTALDLKKADISTIKAGFNVCLARTVYELRGQICYELEEHPPQRKNISVSRSFGSDITEIGQMTEAVCTYAARAAEKLRREKLAAGSMSIYIMTNRFDAAKRFFNSAAVCFETPTDDSITLLKAAEKCLKEIFQPGREYKKAGVVMMDLCGKNGVQRSLFDAADTKKSEKLMGVMDSINRNLPGGKLRFAGQGIEPEWTTRFRHRSGRYTTNWEELVSVR